MYLTPSEKHIVLDVEANGLEPDKLWVCTFKNPITKESHSFVDYKTIKGFIGDNKASGCKFVGHNLVVYDAPVLNRLVGTRLCISDLVDTYILSMCYSPSLQGGHSLEAWGERIGRKKIEHDEWDRYSPEMLARNIEDVEINCEMFLRLTKRMREIGLSDRFCEIEHKAWNIVQNKQKKAGFPFNVQAAHELFAELRGTEGKLKDDIYHQFPPTLEIGKEYRRALKNDGTPTSIYERHRVSFPKVELTDRGGYRTFDYKEFNLGSPKQRIEKLLELGWEPEEFTEKGSPQPTRKGELSPSLARYAEESGVKEIKLIADWLAVNSRGNTISNWLDLVKEDGRIHGNLWLANTLRYRHDKPNTANIPRVRVDKAGEPLRGLAGQWTYESRDLWTTSDEHTHKLVGIDAVAIQFRVLANALKSEEFTNVILSGDIHNYNKEKTGYGDREQNKTFGYAALLGAGAAKTGSIFGVDARTGGKIKDKWIKTVPGLQALYGRLKEEWRKTGRITLSDGAKVLVPSEHMVLAYLLQGEESRIMKQAMIYVDEEVRREGLDAVKIGDIHDEWQNDVRDSDIRRYIEICQICFGKAGNSFDYNIPIECSSKVGLTWAETH